MNAERDLDWESYSLVELLQINTQSIRELRKRKVVRTWNAPVADYAEWLVANKLNLTLETNSRKGYDAIDDCGVRYQIKSRHLSTENGSRQLSVIRNLDREEFDFLIAVIFNPDFSINQAVKILNSDIGKFSTYNPHQNGNILILRGSWIDNYDFTTELM